jgi:hypothetical protein
MARAPSKTAETPAETTEVAVVSQPENKSVVPASLEDEFLAAAGMGAEGINKEDTLVPFLRVIQSLSPQRTRGKAEFIPGIEEGDILETATGDFYKSGDGVFVVPIHYMRRHTEWWPRDSSEGKGLVADYGSDPSCLEKTTKDSRGNNVTSQGTIISVTGDYFCFLVNRDAGTWVPVVVSMGGTQLRKARAWNTRLTTLRVPVRGNLVQPPLFYMLWHLTTVPESNDKGAWMGWKIDSVRPIMEEPYGVDLFREALAFSKKVASGEVKAQVEDPEAGGGAAAAGGGGGAGVPDDEVPF